MMGLVGRRIYGYCDGYFGRDDYEDKIIILEGKTWIVCVYANCDVVACANFSSEKEKIECVNRWQNEEI